MSKVERFGGDGQPDHGRLRVRHVVEPRELHDGFATLDERRNEQLGMVSPRTEDITDEHIPEQERNNQ
jgi:hypothetical protein